MQEEDRNYYLQEFTYFDGESDITFNIIDVDTEKQIITLAVTHLGKISIIEFDLKLDEEQDLYFQYSVGKEKIKVNDFETIDN